MDFLQNLNVGTFALALGGLCVLGVILFVVVNVVGSAFGVVFNVVDVFFDLLTGGPLSMCGCVLGLIACGGCACIAAFAASVLSTCGTPQAMNFCLLFGR